MLTDIKTSNGCNWRTNFSPLCSHFKFSVITQPVLKLYKDMFSLLYILIKTKDITTVIMASTANLTVRYHKILQTFALNFSRKSYSLSKEAISNIPLRVLSDIQTPWRRCKKRRCAPLFNSLLGVLTSYETRWLRVVFDILLETG